MTTQPNTTHPEQAGFTLVELIAVIVILGILAAVIVPRYLDVTDEANDAAAKAALSEGISRVTTAFSKYIITVQDNPEHTNFGVLSGVDYLNVVGGFVDIGDYQLRVTSAAGPPETILLELFNKAGTAVTWKTSTYGGVKGTPITVTVRYPD